MTDTPFLGAEQLDTASQLIGRVQHLLAIVIALKPIPAEAFALEGSLGTALEMADDELQRLEALLGTLAALWRTRAPSREEAA